jgi:hypothetical protein
MLRISTLPEVPGRIDCIRSKASAMILLLLVEEPEVTRDRGEAFYEDYRV